MRRRKIGPARPWTADEDAKLVEICAAGLSSEFWTETIPTRSWGEIAERRLDLKPPLAPLI